MYDITYMIERKNMWNDLEFPRLVSYPRTGSHWFRIIMELYMETPCAVQSFFIPQPTDCWGVHIHDRKINEYEHSEGPTKNLKKVIYLYRSPADTIFSQLKYESLMLPGWNGEISEQLNGETEKLIKEYSDHLRRWKYENKDIESLIEISYENLKNDPVKEVGKVIKFLGYAVNTDRLEEVCAKSNKRLTKTVTPHDAQALNMQAVNDPSQYKSERNMFKSLFGKRINEVFKGLI